MKNIIVRTRKKHILFNSNGLAIWYGFPNITHIIVKNSRMSREKIVQPRIAKCYAILPIC